MTIATSGNVMVEIFTPRQSRFARLDLDRRRRSSCRASKIQIGESETENQDNCQHSISQEFLPHLKLVSLHEFRPPPASRSAKGLKGLQDRSPCTSRGRILQIGSSKRNLVYFNVGLFWVNRLILQRYCQMRESDSPCRWRVRIDYNERRWLP
jgi:hypothetical protein